MRPEHHPAWTWPGPRPGACGTEKDTGDCGCRWAAHRFPQDGERAANSSLGMDRELSLGLELETAARAGAWGWSYWRLELETGPRAKVWRLRLEPEAGAEAWR